MDYMECTTQIKFKSSMLRSILCNYSDTDILVKGTILAKTTEVEEQQKPLIIETKK